MIDGNATASLCFSVISKRLPVLLTLLALGLPGHPLAEILRDPIGVNVSAARPMSLTVRFADSNGGLFTTDEALFCFRQLPNGQCDPSAILGRLPKSRDLGSTDEPVSSITDVMTIPYSVIRSTLSIAQRVDFSDFFYVRKFTPEPGVDLGAGVNQAVYQKVTCHLAGPARVPLSLTRVSLFGREDFRDDPVRLIRLNADNIDNGKLYATVEHTGTGSIEGWWEIRKPGDPAIREIDVLPQAALPAAQRNLQHRYFRLKRFKVQATTDGTVLIEGPAYRELPVDITGRHDILLRFDASSGRENRARLAVPGEPLNVFSGAVAGFTVPVLEYHVAVALTESTSGNIIVSQLVNNLNSDVDSSDTTDSIDNGSNTWHLTWQPLRQSDLVMQLSISGKKIIGPAHLGILSIPQPWNISQHLDALEARLMGPDGEVKSTVSIQLPGITQENKQ